jgi:hypothetical protein
MRARLAASAACDTAGLCLALEQIYRQFGADRQGAKSGDGVAGTANNFRFR